MFERCIHLLEVTDVDSARKSTVDRKDLAYILTTNISKAFDSLCQSLSVKKLELYGFEHTSLNLLRSYFDNRVEINDVTSDWKMLNYHCPSNILSPSLALL